MIKNLQLVIFDMDGLMFDTERIAFYTALEVYQEYNIPIDIEIMKTAIGTTTFDRRKYIIGEIPDDIDINGEIRDIIMARRLEKLAAGIPKKPGLDELIALLKTKNIKIAVGTSTPYPRTKYCLESAGMLDLFDCIVTGDQVPAGKPAPFIFQKACSTLNVEPAQALVLEDSINGALAAKSAGIPCILVPDIVEPPAEIREIVYGVVASLADVAALIF